MNKEYYEYESVPAQDKFYTFTSVGAEGKTIEKVVAFQKMHLMLYNLALADYDRNSDSYSDDTNSNNFDLGKIFATIFRIGYSFLEENPHLSVYIEGNSPIKKRLYQRIIKNNLSELQNNYEVFGVMDTEDIEPFVQGKEYNAFVIRKKQTS
ncbi:MAG: hypothetical protein EAZ95_15775 [Bacteroidetes bacterium]|nr:MAG: hypothetical protein EAZ95_15775 [Bacteroidota bacterium]